MMEVNFFLQDVMDEAALWMEDGAIVRNGPSADLSIGDALVLYR